MYRHHSWFSVGQRSFDALLAFVSLYLICVRMEIPFSRLYFIAGVLATFLTWICMGAMDAYRPWRAASLRREILVLFSGWLLVVFGLFLIAWASKSEGSLSRLVVGVWFIMTPFLIALTHLLNRLVLRAMRKRGMNTRKVVIVGAGDLGEELAARILGADWMGLEILGWFDDAEQDKPLLGLPALGRCEDVAAFVQQHHVDHVYLALPMREEACMRKVFDGLQDTTASVFLLPDLFMFELMGARQHEIGGLPAYSLCDAPFTGPFGMLKRIEDVLLSCIIVLLISPLMLVIALLVKLTSKGPVLFVQDRYGLNGKKFRVYKFRSMTVCENGPDLKQAVRCDVRVTRLGRYLRRTSLDELPQFFNVLQGCMSIVGPRPHAVAHNEQYRKLIKGYMWRHKVKPGITGLAQVRGWRGETDTLEKMRKRVECDLEYIRHWSLWLDLKIILQTLIRGFTGKNSY